MATLALIPARGGSQSMPLKNIKSFCGKPLIEYSIQVAKDCSKIDRTIVSTDSEAIAEIARHAGAEVPFLRPPEYAKNDTPDLPVFIHCLEWLQTHEAYEPEIVVHLRPTSPLRDVAMIEQAIHLLQTDSKADAVRAVCEPSQNPFKMWELNEQGHLIPLIKTNIVEQYNQPRQKLPTIYWQNGYVDVTRSRTILEKHSMTGDCIRPLIVNPEHLVDIDNELTFRLAEKIYEKNKSQK